MTAVRLITAQTKLLTTEKVKSQTAHQKQTTNYYRLPLNIYSTYKRCQNRFLAVQTPLLFFLITLLERFPTDLCSMYFVGSLGAFHMSTSLLEGGILSPIRRPMIRNLSRETSCRWPEGADRQAFNYSVTGLSPMCHLSCLMGLKLAVSSFLQKLANSSETFPQNARFWWCYWIVLPTSDIELIMNLPIFSSQC